MQLKSLKVFCDVVRLGSFSKAAELNGVSQPSASQLVHGLEERLGVPLIDRSRRPFVVTDEGKLYYDGCVDVVRRYEDLERLVRQQHQSPAGRLRVAAIYSVGLGQMHRVVEEFRAELPGVDLHVEYMHPHQVYDAILDSAADLGVMSFPEAGKQLTITPWRDEPFAIAVAPSHPLAGVGTVTVDVLQGQPLVMAKAGLRLRDEVDRWLATHGVTARVAAEFDNLELVKRAIEVGEGVGLLPAPTFAVETLAGLLVRVDLATAAGDPDTFVRPMGVVHRRNEDLSAPAKLFLDLLLRHADDPPEPLPKAAAAASPATA